MQQTSRTAIECPKFIVRVSSAKMPNSVRSAYVHVAVLEVDPGVMAVPAIDTRCRGVRRVVRRWERCYVGRMVTSAAARAQAQAEALANRLNRLAYAAYAENVDREISRALSMREDEI